MRHDHVEIDDKCYRIEFNWNTVTNFLEDEGKTLADLENMGNLTAKSITRLVYNAIQEGCRLEGIAFPFTVEDLGAALGAHEIAEILKIYHRQTANPNAKVKAKKK